VFECKVMCVIWGIRVLTGPRVAHLYLCRHLLIFVYAVTCTCVLIVLWIISGHQTESHGHMCDSRVTWRIHVWRLIHICAVTHAYMHVPWLLHSCQRCHISGHSKIRVILVTWRIHVRQDYRWLICICAVTHAYMHVPWLTHIIDCIGFYHRKQ